MPLHDWTRVPPCVFHDFSQSWIVAISRALNRLFPPFPLYALIERDAIDPPEFAGDETNQNWSSHGRILTEDEVYSVLANRVVIHSSDDDEPLGWIEIVSPSHRASAPCWERFELRQKMARSQEIGLLTVDLFAPYDREATETCVIDSVPPYQSYDKPRRTVLRHGEDIPRVSLSMGQIGYVCVPLEEAYRDAWSGFARRWKEVLDPPARSTGGSP